MRGGFRDPYRQQTLIIVCLHAVQARYRPLLEICGLSRCLGPAASLHGSQLCAAQHPKVLAAGTLHALWTCLLSWHTMLVVKY